MIILDLDNCVADDEWRIERIEWRYPNPMQRYHAYHSLCGWDKVKNRELFRGQDCAVLTARPLFYTHITTEWLKRAGIAAKHLLMRNDNDFRASLDVKRMQTQHLFTFYGVAMNEIKAAYDDRPEIVDMYKALGLPAEVRAIHSTCSYTNPTTGRTNV